MPFRRWTTSILLCTCALLSTSNSALAEPVSPAVAWQIIDTDGCNPTFLRSVATESVQAHGTERSYLMKLEMVYPSGSVSTLERGALVNCEKNVRFEIANQVEWDSRPFSAVYPNTANAKEMGFVCDALLSTNPRFAIKKFPIPPGKTNTKEELTEAK